MLIREDSKADRVKQNNGAGGSQPTLLRKYVERAFEQAAPPAGTPVGKLRRTTYQLDQSFLQGPGRALADDFAAPALFGGLSEGVARELRQEPYFFLGARGSGIGFHRHGETRVIPDCHFSVQLNHFIPSFLSYSVAVFLK